MTNFLTSVWAILGGFSIAVGAIFVLGGDLFFGIFAEREKRTFPVCQRSLFTFLGDNLEWKQSVAPVQSYEVVCGYVAGVANEYGTITDRWHTFEEGRLVSSDTKIPGATHTVECVRYNDPPQKHHSRGWLLMDKDLFCEMPTQGVPPRRD
ncbi:hypothetical protein [Roseovarius nubinhibens]|uniref:Uncharacterized protein n=1 Tax=Roseovarius nubinhibens TaxID=314263 RepID=A0A348WCH5_9RHOB|nr:hypothetical protein [Roseovarius nubinhibens]